MLSFSLCLFKILIQYEYKTEKRNLQKHFFEFSLFTVSRTNAFCIIILFSVSNKRFWRLFVSEGGSADPGAHGAQRRAFLSEAVNLPWLGVRRKPTADMI